MTEPTPPSVLTERALQRLKKLASGNGLEPVSIALLEKQEQVFTLTGKMEVSPLCETQSTSYPGGVRGKDRKMVESFAQLQQVVAKHKQDFHDNPDWAAATTEEIKTHESQGWGLESAKVTLPQQSAIYAATETCPSCSGRQMLTCEQCLGKGTVVCTQCQGQGRELCYYCAGRGEDPQQPGQKCHTCNGTRFATCRFCQMHGYLPCPTCNGRRGTPCPACQATGKTTQEVTVTCGAETHFKMDYAGLPSGLRRGLDRIGIANLGKGHADIVASPAPAAPKEDSENSTPREGAPIPVLAYQVTLPYSEMRMGLGRKKAVISVIGKRCAITGVPNFLDEPLAPWRDKLHQAALGKAPLQEALEARALHEILSLTVAGKDRVIEVRKLYPYGLSLEAINGMLADTRRALNRTTLKTRVIIAVLCVALCAAFFYALFMMGFEFQLTRGWNRYAEPMFDAAMLAAAIGVSWATLNFSTRFVLQRRFPKMALALNQKIGKTGYGMLGGIAAAFIAVILLAPVKPLWLAMLLVR